MQVHKGGRDSSNFLEAFLRYEAFCRGSFGAIQKAWLIASAAA